VTTVSRVSCPDYGGVLPALERALELLPADAPLAGRDEPLLIKPNLLAARPPEAAVTTHPAVLDAVLAVARDLGARPTVADSPGIHSAERVARVSGIAEICRRHGVPLLDLGKGETVTASGRTYRDLTLAREAVEARWLWNLPKWKTHTMMALTLGIKNLYGCVPGKRKIAVHFRAGKDPQAFARQLLDLEQLLEPSLTVLDGVVAMEGPGPGAGTPVNRGLLLASTDTAALDWEATRLSGFAADEVPTVAASITAGRLDPAAIRVVGDPAEPLRFQPAPGSPSDWPLPGPLKRVVKGVISPLPRFSKELCTGCGVCVEACPGSALRPGSPPELNRQACIRCYCCQELCPQGAATVPRRRIGDLFGAVRGRGRL
jgi:uncharacterized protein (DUF362 family)/Pyruvate/2-oxoacid:ferredoxin oxidoreductase delta subunit